MKLRIIDLDVGPVLLIVRNDAFEVKVHVRLQPKVIIFEYLQHLICVLHFLVLRVHYKPVR